MTHRKIFKLMIAALLCMLFACAAATGLAQESLPAPEVDAEEEGTYEEAVYVDFPYEEPPLWCRLLEAAPTILSWPDEPLGHLFERILHTEHDTIESELEDYAIGLQYIPERPNLLLEWNELFLGPGFLAQGIETPTGAIWRPAFWVFGEFRSGISYFDRDRAIDPTVEWANRLDLLGQINLSGTERVLIGLRPFDEERGGTRPFSGYDFNNGDWIDGANGDFQTLFFEGDFGEVFPKLDPYDTRWLDYGFSVGRMPLLAQQGLLINEDMIDAATLTRNTVNGFGVLNLRTTGVHAWRGVNRNSPVGRLNDFDPGSKMVAILTETDVRTSTINLDAAYVYGDDGFGNLFAVGASAISRHHGYENTYNTSIHVLGSFPEGPTTPYADQGELLFAQTSWTPHHTEDLIYLNGFWAIDQFTSAARGPAFGGPLGQTGVLFAGIALGRYGAPIAVTTDDVAGGSLGYQLFFDHTRQQLIWEVGGYKETKGPDRGAVGTALRFQKAIGQHTIFVLDGFASKQERRGYSQGARTELRFKF